MYCNMLFTATLTALLTAFTASVHGSVVVAPKEYTCDTSRGKCVLHKPAPSPFYDTASLPASVMSQSTCLMVCDSGALWPYPTGSVTEIDEVYTTFDVFSVHIVGVDDSSTEALSQSPVLTTAVTELRHKVLSMRSSALAPTQPSSSRAKAGASSNNKVHVAVHVADDSVTDMTLGIDETYSIEIQETQGVAKQVEVVITAPTVFGARHGLETLSQLIAFDDLRQIHTIASSVRILQDGPTFPYRGVMLDVSRSFLPVEKLQAVVKAMGYNKMNVLHLHLSDTASFPVQLTRQPNVTYYGAYSAEEVYSLQDLTELVELANSHGIMVLPEVDGPAHVSAGFEWGADDPSVGPLLLCADPDGAKAAAWTGSSLEPPSGQWNLANDAIYSVLGDVYEDLAGVFGRSSSSSIGSGRSAGDPRASRYFHIGGDEIIVGSDETAIACYNSTHKAAPILEMLAQRGWDRSDAGSFYALWEEYTQHVADLVTEAYDSGIAKLHIWGGGGEPSDEVYNLLTRPEVTTVLPPSRFTIQVWDETAHSITPRLLRQGYDVVLSNTDYVYLDCGNAGYTNPGGYWCQPYHEWQHIYDYVADVLPLWGLEGEQGSGSEGGGRILGSETLVWSEMIDGVSVEQKLWPRTAALAEALWGRNTCAKSSKPGRSGGGCEKTSSWYAADPRMQNWRNVLVQRGVQAEALQTRWCQQRGAYACTVDQGTPQ